MYKIYLRHEYQLGKWTLQSGRPQITDVYVKINKQKPSALRSESENRAFNVKSKFTVIKVVGWFDIALSQDNLSR